MIMLPSDRHVGWRYAAKTLKHASASKLSIQLRQCETQSRLCRHAVQASRFGTDLLPGPAVSLVGVTFLWATYGPSLRLIYAAPGAQGVTGCASVLSHTSPLLLKLSRTSIPCHR